MMDRISNFFHEVARRFGKNHLVFIRKAFASYGTEYIDIYAVERAKLKEILSNMEDAERDDDFEYEKRYIRKAIRLLDIILEDDRCGEYVFTDGDFRRCRYVLNRHVNYRNMGRIPYEQFTRLSGGNAAPEDIVKEKEAYYREYPQEYYIRKAVALYHRIRVEIEGMWWM